MDFTIITPSLNQLPYLKRCAASVKDQKHVDLEHIVVDGLSTDGTVPWLQQNSRTSTIIKKDRGMYEAINRGLKRAQGRILAYLNCDEQYLPGTLEWVKKSFESQDDLDVLFGDILLIRPDGSLIAYRKAYKPRWRYILSSHLYVSSCAMFFKRRIIEDQVFMNPNFISAGDADFVVRLLRSGYRSRHVRKYMSAFTMTGTNLGRNAISEAEMETLRSQYPGFLPSVKGALNLARWTEKLLSGAYFQYSPLKYAVYVGEDTEKRKEFCVPKASFRWKNE